MLEIIPQHLTLDHLFNNRLFRIPQYQRAYSWGDKQRKDLFEDINRTWSLGPDRTHFMATVVGLRRDKRRIFAREFQAVEVVDGQQRITTLILLLKTVAKSLDLSDPTQRKIYQDLQETLVKPDNALLLLQTNHDASNHFRDYLVHGEHPASATGASMADRALLKAMEDCEKFVFAWLADGKSLQDLIDLLLNRLTFVFHEIADEAVVYTVFEVLNSRGLVVSSFDRLKSLLMAIVFQTDTGNRAELINEVHLLWTEIYRCVGLRQGMSTEALRFAATLRQEECPSRPLGEEAAVDLLERQSKGGPADVIQTTKWLKAVTEAMDRLIADRRRNAVTDIVQARLVAVAIHLRSDLESEKADLLRRWESVTFRIYGMFHCDARTAVGDYVRLAWRIINERLSAASILRELSAIGADFPVDDAVEEFRKHNVYKDRQEDLRYFFYRYEEQLVKGSKRGLGYTPAKWELAWNVIWEGSAADSIEHILPQSSERPWIHWLGNLLALPHDVNSRLGATPPKKKGGEYTGTGLLIAAEVVPSLSTWTRRAVIERENRLLDWARREWAD